KTIVTWVCSFLCWRRWQSVGIQLSSRLHRYYSPCTERRDRTPICDMNSTNPTNKLIPFLQAKLGRCTGCEEGSLMAAKPASQLHAAAASQMSALGHSGHSAMFK